jgi:hypothetical protein
METRKEMEEYQEVIARDDRRDDLREKQGRLSLFRPVRYCTKHGDSASLEDR